MRHTVYRNLTSRDTLFGMELSDMVIMACVVNVVFRFHRPELWAGKMLNIVIVALIYLILVYVKRMFPKGFIKHQINFLFKRRRFVPDKDTELVSFYQVIHEKKTIR